MTERDVRLLSIVTIFISLLVIAPHFGALLYDVEQWSIRKYYSLVGYPPDTGPNVVCATGCSGERSEP